MNGGLDPKKKKNEISIFVKENGKHHYVINIRTHNHCKIQTDLILIPFLACIF